MQGTFSETENKSYKRLSLDVIMGETLKCAMMFTSCDIKEMNDFAKIAKEALPNHRIEVLNCNETSNREAQKQNENKQSMKTKRE